ncbi:MAG TPA: CDP-glycerol glycerophosphotransferase family protein [Candidatus Limnocylindria bacterium]|nr:CDP-glycerol glycerophosphotransferase family protein [Candidatus Limnocylindria bacterium]
MNRLEHALSTAVLGVLGILFDRLPIQRRIVLATARVGHLEGNLAFIAAEVRRSRPGARIVTLLEPYSYGFLGKVAYLLRLVRGTYLLRTSSLFVVDNAYLPIHVAPHRPGTTVVQVWHAVGALKRFGADTTTGLAEPERSFLHHHYDYVVCAGDASREPYSRALRTPLARVIPLGAPRTDFFFDDDAMTGARDRVLAAYPRLRDGRVVLYAPTFRGRGRAKRGAPGFDPAVVRAALGPGHVLAIKTHPNLDPAHVTADGFDVVIDRRHEINEVLVAADVLVTDYSSSIYEWALLRRPLVLLTEDLPEYERDPGMYLDAATELIGEHVTDPATLPAAIAAARVDEAAWTAFIQRRIEACDGRASARFVERFVPERAGVTRRPA